MGLFGPSEDQKSRAAKVAGQDLAQRGVAIKELETTQIEEKGQDFGSANKEITKKLWEKQSGKNISAYTKGADIIQSELNKGLEKSTYDYAKQSFEAQYGKADDTTVEKWIKLNQKKIERDMYGALTQQALKDSVEFDKGTMYQDYISSYLETPKQKQSWGEKALDVGKSVALGLIDTSVGVGASITDEVLGTNLYKSYFGDRTTLTKDNDSFVDKISDTMFAQYGLIDVAFGIGTFMTAGTGAPVFASLSAAIKGGGKAIAKSAMKGGAEAIIETSLKKSFASSGDDIFQAIMKNSQASISELAAKEGIDATAYMTRLRGTLRSAGEEGLKKGSKEYKEYFKAVDQFTDVSGLGTSGVIRKQNRWIESIGDGLGLPTQFIKMGEKGGKRIYSASFMGLGMNAAIPATTLLPGVGEWFETTGLRLGGSVASMYVQQTRGGLIESERQKFMEQYGVDPEQSTGKLRSKWDEQINYKLRYALPSEILTGQSFAERSNGGKAVWGTIDMIANFAPVLGGIKMAGSAYGIAQKHLSPIHMEDNGTITSNLSFIRELSEIQNSDLDEATKAQKIEILKQEVANGNPNLVTTIRGTKELESTVRELQTYFHALQGGKNDVMASAYIKGMQDVVALMREGKMDDALARWKQSAVEQSEIGAKIMSPEAINTVNQKIDVLNTYFEKVRNDHGFLSNLTKQFVVNAFTTNVKSPTGAVIRGNEDLIASAKSIFSEIDTIAEVMSNTFSAKGKYIESKFPNSGKEHVLDSRIEQALKMAGLDVTKEMVTAFRYPLVTALTKTQFEMKEFQDSTLEKVFDTVFSDYGLDVKKIGEEGGKSLGEIIMEINSMNIDEVIKISSRIEESMNAKIVAKKADLDSQRVFLESNAIQIAQMDRLYSELTNQLHVQHSRERIDGNEFVRTEEVPLREEIENLKAEIAELKKNKQDTKTVEEDLKIMEDAFKDDPEATVVKDIPTELNPNDSPAAAKMIATDEVQTSIREESEKTWKIYSSEARAVQAKSEILGKFMKGFLESNDRMFNSAKQVMVDKNDIDDMDEIVDKEIDNYYKNNARINEYNDMLYRGIADEYNKTAKRFFEREGKIDVEALKKFNAEKNMFFGEELTKLRDELLALTSASDAVPNKAKVASLMRRINEIINESTIKQFTRDGIMRVATESTDVFDFQRNLKAEIKKTFKFTDDVVDRFMQDQFGIKGDDTIGDLIPFYELYRKQEKIEAFRITFDTVDGKLVPTGIVYSKDNPGDFSDEYGNSTLYRMKALGADRLKEKADIISMNDILIDKQAKDSFWVDGKWGNLKIDAKDRTEFFHTEIMGPVIKEMESQGYIYLGDFQEEGKKSIFIKPKIEGYTRRDALMDLTGIDWNEIDKLPDGEMKNNIAGNFQKYAKLIWWGEINANRGTWEQFIKIDETVPELWKNKLHTMQGGEELIATLSIERDSQVRHLLYEDDIAKPEEYYTENERASGKKIREKVSDGRTFNLPHYGRTLNATTGANVYNQLYKTATNLGKGQFIKSQDIDSSIGNFKDPQVIDAMYKSEDPKISAIVDFTIANFGDRWFDNIEAVKTVQELFQDFRVIDRIIPMSAYKNIFTRGKYLKENVPPIEFESYTVGGVIATDIENIGVKAIDFSHTPKDVENERVKFANQVIRNIHEIRDPDGNILFSQSEADQINSAYNQIRKDDYDALMDYAEKVGRDPFIVIQEIEQRFGVKFSDYQKAPFINANSVDNLTKLMTNVMKRGTTSGTQLKGNQVDLTYPPDYWRVEHIAQQLIEPEFEHNFIILSKKFYGHIESDRAMMFRYPVVSDKVVNAPKIVWAEDIEAQLGHPLDIGASGIPAINLIKRIEGDGDGDKMVLITDPRLQKIQSLVEKYADAPKFEFEVSNTEANKKDTTGTIEEILDRTTYDIFQGKANIGIIDNKQTEVEKYMQMGLIPNKIVPRGTIDPYSGEEFTGYTHDFLRQVLGVTLQRAVDNKYIPLKDINEIIDNSIGKPVFGDNKTGLWKERNIPLFFENKEGKQQSLRIKIPGKKYPIAIKDVVLFKVNDDSVTIIKRLASNASKNEDGTYEMSDAEYKEFRKISAKDLRAGVQKIQNLLKKKAFLSEEDISFLMEMKQKKSSKQKQTKEEWQKTQNIFDKKTKSIKNIRSEYLDVKKKYDELVEFYGKDVINLDPQMKFIEQMEGSFLREFSKEKIQNDLGFTLGEAINQVRKKSILTEVEEKAFNEMKGLLGKYNSIDKANENKRPEMEQKIYAVADKYGIENLDNIIRHHAPSTVSRTLDLMTSKGKDEFMQEINDELMFTNLIRLEKYDDSVDLSNVWKNFGKVDSQKLEAIFKEQAGEYLDNYFDPKRRLMRRDDVNPTIKSMIDMGMSMKEFNDFSETISNLEQPVRERVVTSIKNLEEGDIKAFLEIAKDGEMQGAVELLMSLGYKDIAGEKLVEKTHDAYTTVMNSPFNKPNC